ncbi:MAG: ankyrin repeat domain-containing protein [Holosporaceae bacterium]|jgi:hypothetical protein|nr:ankyrin repeat domain-containing protein [Holosporaceae bacterium]
MKKILTALTISAFCGGFGYAMEIENNSPEKIHESMTYLTSIIREANLDDEFNKAQEFLQKLCFGKMSDLLTVAKSAQALYHDENSDNTGIILTMAYLAHAIGCPFIEYSYRKQISSLCMPIGNVEYFNCCYHIYREAQKDIRTKDDPKVFQSFCEADDLLRAEAQCGNTIAQGIYGANLIKLSRSIAEQQIDGDDNMSGYLALYSYLVKRLPVELPVDGSTLYDLPTLIASLLASGNIASYEFYTQTLLKDLLENAYGENYITSNAFGHLGQGISHILQGEIASYLPGANADGDVNSVLAQKKVEYEQYKREMNNNLAPIASIVRGALVPYVFFPHYVEKYSHADRKNELLECLSCENIPFLRYQIDNYSCYSWKYLDYPLLLEAANNKDLDLVIRLFYAGADGHLTSTNGNFTALHMALSHVNSNRKAQMLKIIKILAMMCDINAENDDNHTAFELACQYGMFDVAELLLDKFARVKIDYLNNNLLGLWNIGLLSPSFWKKALEAGREFVAIAEEFRADDQGRISKPPLSLLSVKRVFVADDQGQISETLKLIP